MHRFILRTFALLFLSLLAWGGAQAQTPDATTPEDTFALKDRYLMRQALYERHQAAFAPPRKNKWSFGVQNGLSLVSGDVRSERGLAIGINLRKALGHVFSIRGQVSTGYARGQNWRPSGGFLNNEGLNGTNSPRADYTASDYPFVFYNYRMRYWDAGLHGVINLGNVSFTNKAPWFSAYLFAGPGTMLYRTTIDALDADASIYDYSDISTLETPEVRQDVLNGIRNLLDGDFETQAEFYSYKPNIANRTFIVTAQLGAGMAFKLSPVVDISLEHRVTWTGDDLLDGQRWAESLNTSANTDYHHFSSVGLNFRFGKNREEALWWSNPMQRPMEELRELNRLAEAELQDGDQDGISDLLDLEPDTPIGVAVDPRGRALDTDGDGLPDFRDKEPFSPKGAEVDAGGVALDGDNDGVIDLFDQEPNTPAGKQVDPRGVQIAAVPSSVPANSSNLENVLPMIHFDLGSAEVKDEFYPDLLRVARFMQANPGVSITVVGHADVRGKGDNNYELSQRRALNVQKLLVEVFKVKSGRLDLEYRGSEELLMPGLSLEYTEENDGLHYLNRRVEFLLKQ